MKRKRQLSIKMKWSLFMFLHIISGNGAVFKHYFLHFFPKSADWALEGKERACICARNRYNGGMENEHLQGRWLTWAKEIQFIAQAGIEYSRDPFDRERFERLREVSAEMLSLMTDVPLVKVRDLFCNETGFQTPKLDSRAAIIRDGKILLVRERDGL